MMVPPSQAQASCARCSCFNPSEPLTQLRWSRLELQLRENQPVSDIERQTIVKVEQDIEGYEREIQRMQLAIVSLQYKRDLAKDYVSRYKSLLAPVRRISDDVLMEIFQCCSAEASISHDEVYLPQLHLSQVCSQWRSVVNALPMLWSTFEMTVYNPTPDNAVVSDTILMNIVNMLLTRSGDHPLTIKLIQLGIIIGNDIHPALLPVLNHSHRWIDATLEFRDSPPENLYSACTGFACLRHLDTKAGETIVAPVAPCLRSLCLDLSEIDVLASNRDFPWSQLREIELWNTTTNQCTDIFSWCKQLQYVSLIGWRPAPSDQPITSATVVSMTFRSRGGIGDFLRLARFPQLHTLKLEQCDFSLASAYSFVSHSPLITTLSLIWVVPGHEEVLELLRLLPTVITFQWYQTWRSGTVDFFSKLCPYPSDSRTLLPQLKHLDVKIEGVADDIDFSLIIVSVVQARWTEKDANERLKSVQLSFPENCLNHDIIRPLGYLREGGMTISIEDKCGFIL